MQPLFNQCNKFLPGYNVCMVDYGTILKRIRQQRKKRKFVQKEVAGWLGVDRTSYTKKETNAAPITIEEFLVLCDRLGTSPTAILRDESSATGYIDFSPVV